MLTEQPELRVTRSCVSPEMATPGVPGEEGRERNWEKEGEGSFLCVPYTTFVLAFWGGL